MWIELKTNGTPILINVDNIISAVPYDKGSQLRMKDGSMPPLSIPYAELKKLLMGKSDASTSSGQ